MPTGRYPAIVADPPWSYSCFTPAGEGRSAKRHYQTMPLADIQSIPVQNIAAADAWLFLWTTGPNLRQAFAVMDSWGFPYSSVAFVWVKTNPRAPTLFYDRASFHLGMGHTTRKNAEFCLLGRRGKPKRLAKDVRELLISPRREHSRKPDELFERVERFCAGPYLEMFSRESRPGWDAWGLETGKFDQAA